LFWKTIFFHGEIFELACFHFCEVGGRD
jgi:hypothetical protein